MTQDERHNCGADLTCKILKSANLSLSVVIISHCHTLEQLILVHKHLLDTHSTQVELQNISNPFTPYNTMTAQVHIRSLSHM